MDLHMVKQFLAVWNGTAGVGGARTRRFHFGSPTRWNSSQFTDWDAANKRIRINTSELTREEFLESLVFRLLLAIRDTFAGGTVPWLLSIDLGEKDHLCIVFEIITS